jgi:hypothetical protein
MYLKKNLLIILKKDLQFVMLKKDSLFYNNLQGKRAFLITPSKKRTFR